MNWLLLIALSIALVELLLRLPLMAPLQAIGRVSGRAMHVVSARAISDHWKEKAMGAYARRTFVASVQLALVLALVVAAAVGIVLAFEQVSDGFETFVLGWQGITGSIVAACAWWALRRRVIRG